jgi:hypothetical protein
VVLRSNQWQTVDLGFEAQPRNSRSLSPRARCRSHTASPDLLIVWLPSTRPVRPSSVLCTRSPTPVTILAAARHVAPAHRETSKRDYPNEQDKSKIIEMSCIQIQTSSSQWLITIKPRNWPLGFSDSLCDWQNPVMKLGSWYKDMPTFHLTVRQFAIKNEFELDIELTCSYRYRDFC